MSRATEDEILFGVLAGVDGAVSRPEDRELMEHQLAEQVMKGQFIPRIVQDLVANAPDTGVQFPVIRSAFSYLFAKSVDSVLIAEQEAGLNFGMNVLYDFNDIRHNLCGVSEYGPLYAYDPNSGYELGEHFFNAFQDVCAKYQAEIQEGGLQLFVRVVSGGLLAVLPHAIDMGCAVVARNA